MLEPPVGIEPTTYWLQISRSKPAELWRQFEVGFSVRVRYHEPTSGIVFLIISISSDMPQESGTIVTIHRRPLLLHSVHIYSVNQMRHNLSDIAFSATLRTSSPYPQSYVVGLTRKKSVYCRIVQYFYNLWIVLRPFKVPNPLNP